QLVPAPEAGATQPAEFHCHPSNTINALNRLKGMLTTDVESYDKLSLDQRSQMRRIMLCVSDTIDKVVKMPGVSALMVFDGWQWNSAGCVAPASGAGTN
ncbi:hypothetical protein ACUODF_50755, partial [Escherichia coli]